MPNYPHILARLRRTVWASTPETVDAVGALYEPDDPFEADAIRLEFKGIASGNDYIRAFQLCVHLPTGVAGTFAFPIANRFRTASPCGNSGAYGSTL